ncbi:type I-G CRISPR-associated RAMP protein Csb1/Cas7g [Thalassoglobus polymorphus]|uniref:CRISPR-associated protein (Cas_GSU0053) n=1 Tax=Thalassoglobus polymorphus TaxID=2527994 RepID=A0A517QHM0_9PLAN|nr:type I-U CRISPR-associated RAMP protein Csb1/Cas7u [Thalassoglobus polymorphus]QDT31132.1 CRISPR-associated protein (Cas_GSU0053) [Thalassoglobus polymorphus]
MSKLDAYDNYLADNGPAALVIREPLMSVEGTDGVIFPATYAAAENSRVFAGGYNIDTFDDGSNICLIDSVGSQANRIEPIFDDRECDGRYEELVPQLRVQAGEKEVSILEAGHRAGDALVRCSELATELNAAFQAVLKGDCLPLAKSAPTSLVFGVWDSRDTQAKLPRLLTSTIRAFDVRKLTRSAQFTPATTYIDDGLLEDTKDKKLRDAYSERGFIHVPASGSHGGIIADGGVRRDATLSLSALRQTCRTTDPEERKKLQRYILGLALVAFTYPTTGYLRQGCNLVLNPDQTREFKEVHGNGERKDAQITHEQALEFAQAAAKDFGIGESKTVPFDKKLAKADLKKKEK